MNQSEVITLTEVPRARALFLKAAVGALPLPGLTSRANGIPNRKVRLEGLRVDPNNLADYVKATGLRFGDRLPVTYPFTVVMPMVLRLLVARDFPFSAVGAVHAANRIEQKRGISVGEPLDVIAHVENLREHRKGLMADAISEIRVGRELVWRQVSTFLHQQRTSLSDERTDAPVQAEAPRDATRTVRVDQSTIDRYAAASGDHNPIHVSKLGARAFGFPSTIAHGAWEMATVLQAVEGRVPDAVTYEVKFGKPILLPAELNLYADAVDDGWDLSLVHPTKGYRHMTATLR